MVITRMNIAKLEVQLQQWGTRLDDLVAEAEQAGAEASNEYHEMIAELKSKYLQADARLRELRSAGGQRWAFHLADAERAWRELEIAIGKLAN